METISSILQKFRTFGNIKGEREIEIRFNSVDINRFNRVLASFAFLSPPKEITDIYFFTGDRNIKYRGRKEGDGDTVYIKKVRIEREDLKDFDIRISLSDEIETQQPEGKDNVMESTRIKNTYTFETDNCIIDASMIPDGKNTTYEIELELPEEGDISKFNNTFKKVYEIINHVYRDGDIIPINQIQSLRSIKSKLPNLNKARDITYSDLTLTSDDYLFSSGDSIFAGVKLDGVRCIVSSVRNDIYAFLNDERIIWMGEIPDWDNGFSFILDAEYYEDDNGNRSVWYFDVLKIGDTDYKSDIYSERRNVCDTLKEILSEDSKPHNYVKLKPIREVRRETFFTDMENVFSMYDAENKIKNTDGIVLTKNVGYNSEEYPVLKWKPSEKMTLDFRIHKNRIVLEGEDKCPKCSEIPRDYVSNIPLKEGKVYEFSYDSKSSTWIYQRPRPDKKYANNAGKVGFPVWKLINDPITRDTLVGRDTYLMRKYHNKIKTELLYKIPDNSTVLDVGVGRGGDISKYMFGKRNIKLIGIEPDKENIEEFKRRADKAGFKPLRLINEPAQSMMAHSKGEKVDLVVFMLSLSFFFESDETLNNLVKTVNTYRKKDKDLRVLFLTIDGDSVKTLRDPDFKTLEKVGITMSVTPSHVDIKIRNSIVKGQREYFVDVNMLAKKLGGVVETISPALGETEFLNEGERIYTSLFKYGSILVESDDKKSKIEIEEKYRPPLREEKYRPVPLLLSDMTLDHPEMKKFILRKSNNPRTGFLSISKNNPDDTPHNITKDLFRITTIGDGGCYIHALLKCLYPEYTNSSHSVRIGMMENLRKELADNLFNMDGKYPYYFRMNSFSEAGFFRQIKHGIIMGENDVSPYQLAKIMFGPSDFISNELFTYIGHVLKVNSIMVILHKDGIVTNLETIIDKKYPTVVIHTAYSIDNVTPIHFEPIAYGENKQLVYPFNHPFINLLLSDREYSLTTLNTDIQIKTYFRDFVKYCINNNNRNFTQYYLNFREKTRNKDIDDEMAKCISELDV